jgi:hypothetical protein
MIAWRLRQQETEGGSAALAWSNELREHLARETKDTAGADELSRLLREHAELRLNPRDRAPRSVYAG